MRFFIDHESHFTDRERKYLSLLQCDPIMEDLVKKIRISVKIPKNGFFEKKEGNRKVTLKEKSVLKAMDFPTLNKAISLLAKIYGLPESWYNTLGTIILFNTAVLPDRKQDGYEAVELAYVGGIEKVKRLTKQKSKANQYVEIVVNENIGFDSLIDTLRKYRKEITILMKNLQTVNKTGIKDINLLSEIMELSKKNSDIKIAKLLEEKYDQRLGFIPDNKSVNIYRNRYKKVIGELPKNKYYLELLNNLLH